MSKTFLTKEGIEKLQQEIQHLKTVELKECIEAVADARDKGDLSENAEYDAAKENYGSDRIRTYSVSLNVLVFRLSVFHHHTSTPF